MFCPNCGNEVSEKAVICVKCGVALKKASPGAETSVAESKDWLTALLLCLFLGCFGIHRFYTKSTGIGVIQLLTLGGCGVWALIDFVMILIGSYKDGNGNNLTKK
jgi:TM2 domain-containing membrane protein YozV